MADTILTGNFLEDESTAIRNVVDTLSRNSEFTDELLESGIKYAASLHSSVFCCKSRSHRVQGLRPISDQRVVLFRCHRYVQVFCSTIKLLS